MKTIKDKEIIFPKPIPANLLWILTFGSIKGIVLLLSDDEEKIEGIRATAKAIAKLKSDKEWWEEYGKVIFKS